MEFDRSNLEFDPYVENQNPNVQVGPYIPVFENQFHQSRLLR